VYTVVDIETTGNGIHGNRITEIALFNLDGSGITDSFSSLVNPGTEIPAFITGLTGITNAMVRQAPRFEDLIPKIRELTEGRVFVAHSVNFDYPIVREEFRRSGMEFARKKLCTVRLARRVFPGLRSYSLGKLCSSLDIPLQDRHRAAGDARATALLFQQILERPLGQQAIAYFLNARSQEATLPPHLPKTSFERLPETPGIYYFLNPKKEVIYVGKAINLKKRVLGHFYDTSEKERLLCRETSEVDYEPSGSELLALLMETAAIKKHFPRYNRAQKYRRPAYGLFSYPDQSGVLHLAINRLQKGQSALKVFYRPDEARLYLEALCTDFNLCARYCHLQEGVSQCGHFRVPLCGGICRGNEPVERYNLRVRAALETLTRGPENCLILENGRDGDEEALVWIADGMYKGYGFVPKSQQVRSLQDLEPFLSPQPAYPETDQAIQAYLLKQTRNGEKANIIKVGASPGYGGLWQH
jgi:DNA polymerase-3 subunit epsilon